MFAPPNSHLTERSLASQSPSPIDEKDPKSPDEFVDVDIDIEAGSVYRAPADEPPAKRQFHWKLWQHKSPTYIRGIICSVVLTVVIVGVTLGVVLGTHRTSTNVVGVPGGQIAARQGSVGPYWSYDKPPTCDNMPPGYFPPGHCSSSRKRSEEDRTEVVPYWPAGHDYVARAPHEKSAPTPSPTPSYSPWLQGLDPDNLNPEALEEFAHRPYVGGNPRRLRHLTPVPTPVVAPFAPTTPNSIANSTVSLSKPPLQAAALDDDVTTHANSKGGPVASNAKLVSGIIGAVVCLVFFAVLACWCCGRH